MTILQDSGSGAFPARTRQRLHQAPRISGAWCGDEFVLLDAKSGTYYTLNRAAGRIWDLLVVSRSTDDLSQRLCQQYDVRSAVRASSLRRDVMHLLDKMTAAGLVVAEWQPMADERVGQ